MLPNMKSFVLFLIGLIAAVVVIYQVPTYRQKIIQVLSYSQCDSPLPYKLGSIDQRFRLTDNEALNDINASTDLWSAQEGKQLFINSPDADLTVNFVYDQRQALDTAINQLNAKLQQNNSSLQQQVTDYQNQVDAFEQKLTSFNNTVNKYNREGGAPPSVYNDLVRQQNELNAQGDALNARARQLNLSTNNYNEGVSVLNQDVNRFNDAIAQKPEEGVYDSGLNTITIYFAGNRQELLHTLAHEFGHSLGMVHVNNQNAIMYPFTTKSITVTPDDIQQLNFVCREQSVFVHFAYQFEYWLGKQIQKIIITINQQ